jgi:cytochrome b pre-mRNA-processing protein 3
MSHTPETKTRTRPNLFDRLFGRGRAGTGIATRVYGAIVAQARNPAFYASLGVPDTVTGRFEMVVLHVALVVGRLEGDETGQRMAQDVFDLFCTDMDRSLRELGFGDLGVPHRMKKMTEAFYGRARAYRDALAAGDRVALAAAIARNALDGETATADALASYVIAASAALTDAPVAEVADGPRFVDPALFVTVQSAVASR